MTATARSLLSPTPGIRNLDARTHRAVALLVALTMVAGCASIAFGSDPVVVRAEQALATADAIYADGMAYYFTPGVAAGMSPGTKEVFEKVRTGFDKPYKDVQKALDTYKVAKRALAPGQTTETQEAALRDAITKLASLINQVLGHVPVGAQTKSAGKPLGGA